MALTAFLPKVVMSAAVPRTCDSGFYDVLSHRAWMEGQREIEVAEKLILKPDSVLEYSCFGKILDEAAAGTGFASAATGVNLLARTPSGDYLTNNFSHPVAGGTFIGPLSAVCDVMYTVWDFLKCTNFDKDDFITFAELSGKDIRTKPVACTSSARNKKWKDTLAVANPPIAVYPSPSTPVPSGGPTQVLTYLELLDPTSCKKVKPVPTGLMVQTSTGSYPDAICAPAWCHYNGSSSCQ